MLTSTTRICPGRHLADASLFIVVASVLHTLNIEPPLDEYGQPIKLEAKMSTDLFLSCVSVVLYSEIASLT